MSDSLDIERVVAKTMGHACAMICPFCARGISRSKIREQRVTWYHPDILGRPAGHECLASKLWNSDDKETARRVIAELRESDQGGLADEGIH